MASCGRRRPARWNSAHVPRNTRRIRDCSLPSRETAGFQFQPGLLARRSLDLADHDGACESVCCDSAQDAAASPTQRRAVHPPRARSHSAASPSRCRRSCRGNRVRRLAVVPVQHGEPCRRFAAIDRSGFFWRHRITAPASAAGIPALSVISAAGETVRWAVTMSWRVPPNGGRAGQQFVGHDAKRVDVAPAIDRAAPSPAPAPCRAGVPAIRLVPVTVCSSVAWAATARATP